MAGDRRLYQRLARTFRVEVEEFRFPPSSQTKVDTVCQDISSGGLLIESPHRYEVGDKLQLKIHISGLNKYHPSYFKVFESDVDQYLVAVAEVARVEEQIPPAQYLIGIRFVDVYEDDWRALHGLIQKKLG